MISEVKIAAMVLAGILSCQSAGMPAAVPAQTEMPVVETIAVTEPPTEPVEEPAPLAPMVLYQEWLPLSCTAVLPKEDMGQVHIDEVPGHDNFPHTFTAYLPPHYDPYGKYDLLIFLGPYNGKQGDCVDKYQSTWYTEIFRFRTVFDHLILENRVRPFIMIQPDFLEWKDLELNYDTISQNIEEELMPYLAEHYAIYAEDGSHEALVAARDHVAMGGCSLGGMYAFRGFLGNCIDVASSFCAMSCNINMLGVKDRIEETANQYPLKRVVYTVGGIEEQKMKQMVDHIHGTCSNVLTDDVFIPIELAGTHHHYSTWAAGLWNSIQLMFREDVPLSDMLEFTQRQSDEDYLASLEQ